MWTFLKHRLYQNLSLLTRFLNVNFYFDEANITTSARAYRDSVLGSTEWSRKGWTRLSIFIDYVLGPGKDGLAHCESSWKGRVQRAVETQEQDAQIEALLNKIK